MTVNVDQESFFYVSIIKNLKMFIVQIKIEYESIVIHHIKI